MLLDALLDTARRAPRDPAVSDPMRTLSYGRVVALARVFRDIALRNAQSQRVGIMLPASAIFPPVLFGVLWAKKVAVPLNFLLAAEELEPIVCDAKLDLILTVRHFAPLCAGLGVKSLYLDELPLKRRAVLTMFRPQPPAPKVDPDDTAVILYTSGTSGQPKGVELTQRNIHSNCVDIIDALKFEARHTFLNILPPFHVFGLTGGVLVPIMVGAAVHAIPRFNPAAVVRNVATNNISVMMAIPSMYGAILRLKSPKEDSFRSLELAVSGGEPLSDGVREKFQERFGVSIRQGYGLTETSPVVAICTPTHHRDGTVGRPIRNVEVRIVSDEGRVLPPGERGEIHVRGPGVMKGYLHKPDETQLVINAEGWFATGDIGALDADGFLSITGRAKEMLIIGGENVFPREIEAVLESHDGVAQAAVIGIPDELRGEAAIAFVIPDADESINEADLRQHAKKTLAGFKVPKQIIVREDLPVGPTGKIVKRQLAALLSE